MTNMDTSRHVNIVPVPLVLLGKVWGQVAPLLLRGLAESPNITLQRLVDDLLDQNDQLWTIFVGRELSGVFVTHVFEDESGRAVDVYALAGNDVNEWGKPLSRKMVEFARENGCSRIIFCGRKGLLRAYEGVRIVGELKPGVYHFERAVQ